MPSWLVKRPRSKWQNSAKNTSVVKNFDKSALQKKFCAVDISDRTHDETCLLEKHRHLKSAQAMTMRKPVTEGTAHTTVNDWLRHIPVGQCIDFSNDWNVGMQEVCTDPTIVRPDEAPKDQRWGLSSPFARKTTDCAVAPRDHSKQFDLNLDQLSDFEGADGSTNYAQNTNSSVCFVKSDRNLSSTQEANLPSQVHATGRLHCGSTTSPSNPSKSGMHQQRGPSNGSEKFNVNSSVEQNNSFRRTILRQEESHHQTGGDNVARSLTECTTHHQRLFVLKNSPSTETELACIDAPTGPTIAVSSESYQNQGFAAFATGNLHCSPVFKAGRPFANLQSEGHFLPTLNDNWEHSASQSPRSLPQETCQAQGHAECPANCTQRLLQVGCTAANSSNHPLRCLPDNAKSVQDNQTEIESAPLSASSMESRNSEDTSLPSSLNNLQVHDAYSVIGPFVHQIEAPSACSQEASKKERTTDLGVKIRENCDGISIEKDKTWFPKTRRLTTLLSELRKRIDVNIREEDSLCEEPPQKAKRKKIRCKVQQDEKKQRGRRGPRIRKTETEAHASNLMQKGVTAIADEFAETGMSFIGKTPTSVDVLLPLEDVHQFCRDEYADSTLVCLRDIIFREESATCRSDIYNDKIEPLHTNQSLNMVENYENLPFVDFLGLSDKQHCDGDKAISTTGGSKCLALFGCRDLASGDSWRHRLQMDLPSNLFAGENSCTGSTSMILAEDVSPGITDLVHVQGRSNQLPWGKVNSNDNLQLVLYNQKRDMVASRFRPHKKIRAKVLLDPESQRVWLQLENGAGPKENDDPDKAVHWDKQRREMREKVELFIKKMHDVQGNRKFSPWKGSIVDSVVGAFLTQNVSDHLSSSAFMSIASRFPPGSTESTCFSCQNLGEAFSLETECELNLVPPSLEISPFSFAEEPHLSRKDHCEDYASNWNHENTSLQREFAEVPVQPVGNLVEASCTSIVEGMPQCHHEMLTTKLGPQIKEKQEEVSMFTFDCEASSFGGIIRNSSDTSIIEDISGSFNRHLPIRSAKACRMLDFRTDCKNQLHQLCSALEPSRQGTEGLVMEGETTSDNISDQNSESESVAGSSGSVHSVQDSNFQSIIVQESTLAIDTNDKTAQPSSKEIDTGADAKIDSRFNKKRPMSLSSISGMERARLEANQKGRKRNYCGDWESVRKQALGLLSNDKENLNFLEPRLPLHEDSVNWEAVRLADLAELADTIKERGMHHVLSGRIKAFLTSVKEEHGSTDLEWLRNLSSEKAREYLMSIHGLGVKSVECIRLLTLHHLAFPVDTNVGRICVRLGWVPIEPLPEEVQLHLVELYPIQETVQKYLWPRLCTLDQRTLYELHYQLITFGKVFCTKSKPNCNACPMRTECKHFASSYASAKPLLTGPQTSTQNKICSSAASKRIPALSMNAVKLPLLEYSHDESLDLSLSMEVPRILEVDNDATLLCNFQGQPFGSSYKEFFVEEPLSPERTFEPDVMDIEDMEKPMYYYNNYTDYSTELWQGTVFADHKNQGEVDLTKDTKHGDLNLMHTPCLEFPSVFGEGFCSSSRISSHPDCATKIPPYESQALMSCNSTSERCNYSTDLVVEVAQTAIIPVPEAAKIPAPKLKSIGRLRTIHYVYELPDDHSLLKMVEVDRRETDDPCCYLLAIWSPGEIPESQQEIDELCRDDSSTYTIGRADENVAGTLLIPCRTAMHGSFPLNGTYFQVNEVFADHESSMHPLQVPRSLIWSLRRRFVYFGTSVPNIFKGLSTEEIKDCFWRGHVCVRGFDRKTRAPKPLVCRLHFPISKQPQKATKGPGKKLEERAGLSLTSHT